MKKSMLLLSGFLVATSPIVVASANQTKQVNESQKVSTTNVNTRSEPIHYDYINFREDDSFSFHTEWSKLSSMPSIGSFTMSLTQNDQPVYNTFSNNKLIAADDSRWDEVFIGNVYDNPVSNKYAFDTTFINKNLNPGIDWNEEMTFKIELPDHGGTWTYIIPKLDSIQNVNISTQITPSNNDLNSDLIDVTINWDFDINYASDDIKIESLGIYGKNIKETTAASVVKIPVLKLKPQGSITIKNNHRNLIKTNWEFQISLHPNSGGPHDIWNYSYPINFNFLTSDYSVDKDKIDVSFSNDINNIQIQTIELNHPGVLNDEGKSSDIINVASDQKEIEFVYDVGYDKEYTDWNYTISSVDLTSGVVYTYSDFLGPIKTESYPVTIVVALSVGIFLIILLLVLVILILLWRRKQLNKISAVSDGYYVQGEMNYYDPNYDNYID